MLTAKEMLEIDIKKLHEKNERDLAKLERQIAELERKKEETKFFSLHGTPIWMIVLAIFGLFLEFLFLFI